MSKIAFQKLAALLHAHPGSPCVFGLIEDDRDLEFPDPMSVVGISRSAKGYCMVSVLETMKTLSLENGLTEEALGLLVGESLVKVGYCGQNAMADTLNGLKGICLMRSYLGCYTDRGNTFFVENFASIELYWTTCNVSEESVTSNLQYNKHWYVRDLLLNPPAYAIESIIQGEVGAAKK
ncbi:hypothetical protein L1987_65049 [Smallanthus sonchifolius]|uniref:Uncharacterized protein n=1 Tax=Smallanthus sonchifolius TaxID=185202 RepID=A0ACB9BTD2_9ASTR|nr:hypothetical protein L1987_65049 [Smallanthus sonchifolius]